MGECTLATFDSWVASTDLDKVQYITPSITPITDAKLGADGRTDLFDWLSKQLAIQLRPKIGMSNQLLVTKIFRVLTTRKTVDDDEVAPRRNEVRTFKVPDQYLLTTRTMDDEDAPGLKAVPNFQVPDEVEPEDVVDPAEMTTLESRLGSLIQHNLKLVTKICRVLTTRKTVDDDEVTPRLGFLKSPNILISPKIANGSTGFKNGFTTPRSRGRSAMYHMARTPYARSTKAYMDSGPYKVAQRQDLVLHNNTTGFLKSPNILISPKITIGSTGFENGFTTPRSRGRSAMYHMARTPYARYPSTFTQKGITSSYGREEALTSSQSAFQHEGEMALKRRSSVLDDDIRLGGPLRRTRQKDNLLTLRDKRELGCTTLQQPNHVSQKLLLMNEPEPKIVKGAEQNKDTSMHGSGSVSGYANVPTKSTQTAIKVLQHLKKMDLKENFPGSTKSPMKLTLDMLHGHALRSLEKVDSPKLLSYPHDNQKSEVQHPERLHDSRELTSKGKENVEDNRPRKFPITRNMMSPVNGELSVTSKDKAPAVRINEPPLKLPAEPQKKKRPFQMSAREDDLFELDDDDETRVNGHMSLLLVESNKQKTALAADIVATSTLPGVSRTPALVEPPKKKRAFQMSAPEDDSFETDDDDETQVNGHVSLLLVERYKQETALAADIVATSTLQGVSRTPALVENNKQMFPEVVKVLEQAEPKESEKPVSFPKIDVGFGGSVSEQVLGFKLPESHPLTTNTQNNSLPQATLPMDNVVPERDSNSFPLFGTSAERASPFASSANGLSDSKPSASSDPKALESTSVSNSVTTNDHAKLIESNKVENGNDHKSANIFGKVESNKTESGCYQQPSNIFGKSVSKDGKGNDEKAANIFGNLDVPASTALPGTPTNGISTTTTRTPASIFSTSTPTPVIPSCVPALVFSFGSAPSTTPTISVAETGNTSVINDKDLKSNSPFASTPFSTTTTTTTTGSGLFGFSYPAVTSTTKNHSKASFFNVSNGSQANTQVVVTPSVPFLFGSGTTSIPSSTSGTSPFSSSASTIGTSSSFGISSMTASSQGKYGNSTSGPATSIFGSTWDPVKSSRFGTTYNFGASATPTPSATTSHVVFGPSSTHGSTKYSFGAGATSYFSTPTQNQSHFGILTPVPATSKFGSTWDPAKSSGFGTKFNFGASATPTPSATTSPVVFGASSSRGSTKYSFGPGADATSSFSTPTQNQSPLTPVFGNSTSGPAIFGSTWDLAKSSGFGTTYNFGASTTSTPSATTSPVVFGASSTRGSTKFSFGARGGDGACATSSFSTPTQNQSPLNPVFGNSTSGPVTSIFWSTWDPEKSSEFGITYNDHMSMDSMEEDCMQTRTPVFGMSVDSMVAQDTHLFGTGAITNNYDHMSMDSMVEDCMQTPTPVPTFGQTSVASPLFKFDSATQPPMSSYALHPGWWPAKTSW
ncbi:hypothetical protein Tco_0059526 [Tanacetum coccineum]